MSFSFLPSFSMEIKSYKNEFMLVGACFFPFQVDPFMGEFIAKGGKKEVTKFVSL